MHIPLPTDDRLDARDTIVLEAESACVAVLTTRRLGLESKPVRAKPGDSGIFTSTTEAQTAAEALRKQGTYFYVRELPALVLRSATTALVLVDAERRNPFSNYRPFAPVPTAEATYAPPFAIGMTQAEVVASFIDCLRHWDYPRPSFDWLLVGQVAHTAGLQLVSKSRRLKNYESYVSQKWLCWNETAAGRSWKGTHSLAAEVQGMFADAPGYGEALDEVKRAEDSLPLRPGPADHSLPAVYAVRRRVAELLQAASATV